MKFKLMLLALMVAFACSAQAEVAPGYSKLTDLAALSIQDQSIKKLESLIRQYQGTSREPELLSRLADLYLERSGLSFRISEGASVKNKSPLYHKSLKDGVRVLTLLLNRYPFHATAAMAHFKRGKAYKELQQVSLAREDYLYLDQHFHDFDFLDSALIDLSDFAQDANQHQEALTYLSEIEKMTESEYRAIAFHKAAWSYFNLGIYESAIQYLKKEIDFYYAKIDLKKGEAAAESAFLESAFNDLSLFYFEAINKKASFASIPKALQTFHDFDTHQQFFGQTVLKFSKLLKAYTLLPELDQMRKKLLGEESALPETSEVVLLLFQFYFDRRDFNNLTPLLTDLKKIRNEKTQAKIEQILASALADLHKLVLKNKLATERDTLVRPLVSLTESVNELLGKENPTSLLAQYSLAETLFELGEFARATDYYQSLLKPEYELTLSQKKLSHSTLTLRLLSSRYQEIKKEHLLPEKLKIQSLATKVEPAGKDQLNRMSEWIGWLDGIPESAQAIEDKNSYDAFRLEAARLVYIYFDREKALERLTAFGKARVDSTEGITALSIALDTLSESKESARLYKLSTEINTLPNQKNKDFIAKTKEMSANSHLRVTLESKDASITLARTEECIKEFKSSSVISECKTIHAKTLVELKKYDQAQKEISELLSSIKDDIHQKSFLLLRADIRNKLGQTESAIQDLTHYQQLTQYQDTEITEQILEYTWFRNDPKALNALLANPKVCQGKNQSHCDQYKVVQILENGNHSVKYLTAFKNTVKAEKEIQSVWALYALDEPKKLPFQDRLILLQRLANSYESLNPLLQVHLFPRLVAQVNETLESIRISAPGIAPLSSDPQSIERRMKLMQDIDLTFSKVLKLGWLEIKSKGIEELGLIYKRLVDDLRAIHTPEDLLKPFVQKVAEVKTAAENLESMAILFKPMARTPAEAVSTPEALLTSSEVKAQFPAPLWTEWTRGVQEKRRDYLFHLISIAEIQNSEIKNIAPLLKGITLLLGNAPTEAYAMIESAPDSPWKATLVTQFQRKKQ